MATCTRAMLDELVGHYGNLPINTVVQIALRQLHSTVFPEQYAQPTDQEFDQVALRAGGVPLTKRESAQTAGDALLTGKQVQRKYSLGADARVRTVEDVMRAHEKSGAPAKKAASRGTAAKSPARNKAAKASPGRKR